MEKNNEGEKKGKKKRKCRSMCDGVDPLMTFLFNSRIQIDDDIDTCDEDFCRNENNDCR